MKGHGQLMALLNGWNIKIGKLMWAQETEGLPKMEGRGEE